MSTTLSATAAGAVTSLQFQVEHARPGSDEEQIAEIALAYVLDRASADGEVAFLTYDCRRNAQFAFHRSRKRGRGAIAEYTRRNYAVTVVDSSATDIVAQVSVEDEAIAGTSTFCSYALEQAAALGPQGPLFVRWLMAGDTVAEAAQQVGIARATAYRWRASLATMLAPHRKMMAVA